MPLRSFFRRLFTRKQKTPHAAAAVPAAAVPAAAVPAANTTKKKRARLPTPNKPSGSYAHLKGYKPKSVSSRKNSSRSPYHRLAIRGTDTRTNNKAQIKK